jgi:hypothetical protein
MAGIPIHGNDHFILSGPRPDEAVALALARQWFVIRIVEPNSTRSGGGRFASKNFARTSNAPSGLEIVSSPPALPSDWRSFPLAA